MGFYDTVTLDQEYPEYGIARGTVFQSKSLYAGIGDFTITSDGTLVEHLCRFETDLDQPPRFTWQPPNKRVHIGDKVIEYHGDILLSGDATAQRFEKLVARFTHGRLEWIRPLDQYPEANRLLLVDQRAR
jgi:hypothetical protein